MECAFEFYKVSKKIMLTAIDVMSGNVKGALDNGNNLAHVAQQGYFS